MARTPVFYRLEQVDDAATSVGYVRLKEFNALARKDVVTGTCSFNLTNFILCINNVHSFIKVFRTFFFLQQSSGFRIWVLHISFLILEIIVVD